MPKPHVSITSRVASRVGSEVQYDDENRLYDSETTFYDGVQVSVNPFAPRARIEET